MRNRTHSRKPIEFDGINRVGFEAVASKGDERMKQGYDPVTDLREVAIEKVADREWYVGVYDDAPAPACAQRAGKSGRKALLIHSRFLRSEEKV